jgi:hypothetical protein
VTLDYNNRLSRKLRAIDKYLGQELSSLGWMEDFQTLLPWAVIALGISIGAPLNTKITEAENRSRNLTQQIIQEQERIAKTREARRNIYSIEKTDYSEQ